MFTTRLSQFSYSPVMADGHIVKNRVALTLPIGWLAKTADPHRAVVVPAGFKFDLASVPWWLGGIAQKLGRHQRAACLHDYLYRKNIGTRAWADKQFRLAMQEDQTAGWRRWAMWAGVRVGGWWSW